MLTALITSVVNFPSLKLSMALPLITLAADSGVLLALRTVNVTLNCEPAKTFRVNHTFQGVLIPRAGRFVVRFEYWPRLLTPSLWLAAAGCIFLASAAGFLRATRPAQI